MAPTKQKSRKKKKKADATSSEARVELIGDDGDATPAFQRCLIELFGRFDTDGDKLLNEAELKAFSAAANGGREFTADEMEEIQEHFDWKEGKDGAAGGLTLRGWLQMYQTQTAGEEEETWRDLFNLGYDERLARRKEGCTTKNEGLQQRLEELVRFGDAGEVAAFVAAFVPADLDAEEREDYASRLLENESAELRQVVAELRCCATGAGVFEIEGDSGDADFEGPVVFKFQSPMPGAERVDREVVFVKQAGEWRTEG